ncbi:hypothetical protein HDU86_000275 [Geranomyces michiganensis]|nr:hypothetical protein HDU86_000275 [Geranomyces michiganensis]
MSEEDVDPYFWAYIHAAQAGFKRVSFRLVLLGTLSDLGHAIAWILSVMPTSEEQDPLCIGSMFGVNIFLLASLFGTASIGMNLLLVFVLKLPPGIPYEKIYYSVSAVLALVLPLIALLNNWFGWDGTECWYTIPDTHDGEDQAFIHKWTTNYGWVLLVSTFCLICTVLFHISFYRRRNLISSNENGKHSESSTKGDQAFSKTEKLIARVVGRIRWYCLVPILAHTCSLAGDILQYRGKFSPYLLIAANFTSGLMGALNSTVFLFLDPSFETARSQFRAHLVFQYYLRHFTIVPLARSSSTISRSESIGARSPTMSVPSTPADASQKLLPKPADAEEGLPTYILKPRGIVPTGWRYHTVRLLLLRQQDITMLMEGARRGASEGRGKRKSMSASQAKMKLAAAAKGPAFGAQEESMLSGSAADYASDALNRL